jgi:hypothetical protein
MLCGIKDICAKNLPVDFKILSYLNQLHIQRYSILQNLIFVSTGGNRKFVENKKNIFVSLDLSLI